MARFLFAIIVSVVLLGTVGFSQYALTREVDLRLTREVDSHDHDHSQSNAGDTYTLRITPTFDVSKDPFALRSADESDVARIRVSHQGEDLVYWTKDVQKGKTIEIRDVRLPEEEVELLFEATPDPIAARMLCALRVEILRDGTPYADQTLWSVGGGAPIRRRVDMKLKPALRTLDRGLSVQDP